MRNPINWHKAHKQSLTPGERAADMLRNTMGSWAFVFGFLAFLGIWAFLNTSPNVEHWDKYPFILLNLFLSMLAALQGAILLIAAKRMDAISAAQARRDLTTDLASKQEIEQLMEQNREQLKAIAELKKMLESSHR
ncbi:MAG TPA: DUF1003 domain-containing protein [Candidatus Saccharimonadales bacterium]|jgi:uncharacterized membrane protein